ncbi:biotin/lipoate A/B protein ligase family protein [Staphylococcus hominis]|jgi:lipoate-protein ligase A|uniref:Octanoyltransferase LipM n=1 Tax=Staphylococcus hominis TaxID=1290 RepID=A0A974KWS0_STAHO|nr:MULTISPECIES: biotin/lipoate A/B protein ligase family protein [Staphylococcus]EEK11317.1 biotin/lipoate A/B protein ligase family protein [Staphylococcus hominis SK119]EFS18710.1 lipoate-protein ligase A family protein [Staphylococcus hominis subsp. hominis C80]EHR87594.1 biotin/lipoate A/B protein ligase family protein [Staphylococcus hominis VCU122]MBJ6366306.1 lipoate--protein ligase family protein [Staphylococcus hominis]MCC3710978.1 lipoate--protein ligase family protein [Staphylococc
MTETWNFINTGSHDPYYNMAMDEALLNFVSRGEIDPVVRFYTWDPATLSVGYFQRLKKEIDIDKVKEKGFGLVRRQTGGRGVLHDKELTYSVIVPESHPNMPSTITEAYRVISEGLLEGFKLLGFDAYFAIPRSKEEREKLKQPRSAVCFDAPSWYELVVEGRKIAGSAQTRQKGVILQHGSLLQDVDVDELFDMFIFKNDRLKEKMKKAFVDKAVAINDISDRHISIEEMEKAFEEGFKKGLNIEFKPLSLTENQLAEVKVLEEKYRSEEWLYKK